jgi:hypothetical protein
MRLTRRATRDQLTNPDKKRLPDAVGGTITGGPTQPIGVLEILALGAREAGGVGAVSGAAQVMADLPGDTGHWERGIVLSDGSRICFASIVDAGLLRNDDVSVAWDGRPAPLKKTKDPVPTRLRAGAEDKVRAADIHHARVLAPV